jgi:exonuclease III/regulator of replication initiation timing
LLLRAFAVQKWPFHKNLQSSYMDNQIRNRGRTWKIICWNIRGINSSSKWNAIRSKIHESSCDIICIQETKRQLFNQRYIRQLCPRAFDCYEYAPSEGASGGILTIWKSSKFTGHVFFRNRFALSLELTSVISGESWILTNVYAPCTLEGRSNFLNWLNDIDMPEDTKWLIIGDFNLIRRPSDKNRPGGSIQDMLEFNATISNLRLEEIKLYGNKFTWSNKQSSPFLERLDWFFGSVAWMAKYPGSHASTQSRDCSDHSPCLITMNTDIPKVQIFRFENYWLLHEEFMQIIEDGWNLPNNHSDKARRMVAKLKTLMKVLRQWQQQLSNLTRTIEHIKTVILFLDTLEEFRNLALEEWNFRKILQEHLTNLPEQQRVYWMQRGRIKWATPGDENTKFFHSTASIRHNKNSIMMLKDRDGLEKYNHEDKAEIIWEAFKDRTGNSEVTEMHFDLRDLIQPAEGFNSG